MGGPPTSVSLAAVAPDAPQQRTAALNHAFLERRYNLRVRSVRDLSERFIIMRQRGLVLVDADLTSAEADRLLSLLASPPSRSSRAR